MGDGLALLAALAVFHPLLRAPRYDDDRMQLAWLRGLVPTRRPIWDLYAWVRPGDYAVAHPGGHFPWWAPPGVRTGVFRPLASLTLWFDVHALRGSALAAHVHSMLWLALLALAAGRFFRALLPREGSARVALVALLTSAPLAFDLGWLCNRCAIMSCALGLLTLDRMARWCSGGARRDLAAGVALWLLALGAGEYAFAVLPLAASLVFRADAGDARRGRLGALTLGALSVGWFLMSVRLGYGGADMNAAIDPAADPVRFLTRAPGRVVVLVVAWLRSFVSSGVRWLDALAAVALLAVALSALPALSNKPQRRALALWVGAFLASCAVLSAALLQVRVLLPAMISFAGALGALWQVGRWRRARQAAIVALIALQASSSWQLSRALSAREQARDRALIESGRRLAGVGSGRFLVVTASDAEVVINPARAWAAEGLLAPRAWVVVGAVDEPMLVVRTAAQELRVRSFRQGPILPRGVGAAPVRVGGVTLEPRAFRDGAATEVLVTFPADPTSLGWTLVEARGTRLEALRLPPVNAGRLTNGPPDRRSTP